MIKIEKNKKLAIVKLIQSGETENLDISLDGENSSLKMLLIIIAENNFYYENTNKITLNGKNSTADILIKSISYKNSKIDLKNILKISQNSENCFVNLEQKNIQMENGSTIISLPALELENNTCLARHSVQFSEIDADTIYYLTSKKIPEKKAKKIIIKSFLTENNENFLDKKELNLLNKKISKIKL